MDNAREKFESYVDFWVKFKPSVADKILFCIDKGMESPQALIQRLKIAKGNLTNYCKVLIADEQITKQVHGRIVRYGLTAKGKARIKKFLEKIK